MSEKPIVVEARCRVCGRRLTDPESVKAGIGPVCAEKLKRPGYFQALSPSKDGYAVDENVAVIGFPWRPDTILDEQMEELELPTCPGCGKANPYPDSLYCPHCGAPMKARTLEVVLA